MRLRKLLIPIFLLANLTGFAQIGGESTFGFLNLTNSARMAALGGTQVAPGDPGDLNIVCNNPALLSGEMTGSVLANYVSYMAGINYGYAASAFNTERPGPISLGIHYINYGKFTQANAEGEKEGTFTAAEYALLASWAMQIHQIKLGITVKPLLSSLEAYQSLGIAFDLGMAYTSGSELTTLGFVIRNIGTQLTTYYEGADHESLPLDIQLGFSQKLAHAPIRLLATMQHLQRWQLIAADDETEPDSSFGKNLLRHFVLGTELMLSENFQIRGGYNFQRREELLYEDKKSTVGFSWGFGFRIKRFRFDYGSARYHLSSSSNHFSIAFRLHP
jgi:hypothetical protein